MVSGLLASWEGGDGPGGRRPGLVSGHRRGAVACHKLGRIDKSRLMEVISRSLEPSVQGLNTLCSFRGLGRLGLRSMRVISVCSITPTSI